MLRELSNSRLASYPKVDITSSLSATEPEICTGSIGLCGLKRNIPLIHAYDLQVLAINRGEDQKVLTVKISMPDGVKARFARFAHMKFVGRMFHQHSRQLVEKSIEDSFDRLIQPQMCRHIR